MLFKGILLGLYVFVRLAESGVPVPGSGALKGYCNDSNDCKKNQCCVIFKRYPKVFKETPALQKYVKGTCKRLGRKNSRCLSDPKSTGTAGLYYKKCPCKRKFTCTSSGKKSKYGMKGRCTKIPGLFGYRPVIAPASCISHVTCGKGQCCMRRLRGKRATNDRAPETGLCEPRGDLGDGCHVPNSMTGNGLSYNSCPCKAGLTCLGTGVHEQPIGEIGKCH